MKTWRYTLLRQACRLGAPGLIGLVLALAAVLRFAASFPAGRSEAAALSAGIASAEQQLARLAGTPVPEDPMRALAHFDDAFPPERAVAESLGRLYARAGENGLVLDQARYTYADRNGSLARYEINLPVEASYPQLRAFVAAALAEQPTLALEDLTLKRDAIGKTRLSASLRFALYVRAEP